MQRLLKDATALTGVKYDINNLADVYSAIHAIQENLGITGTTAKEAEKTISGSANMMKASWQNVLSAIAGGGDLDRAINNLVYSIQKYFQNIVPVVQRSLVGIGQLIEQVAPLLVQNVASALIQAIPSLLNAIYQMIIGLGKGIADGIKALFTGGSGSVTADIKTGMSDIAIEAGNASTGIEELGDATEKAGKQAKKALLPFDELQKLSSDTGSTGGAKTETPVATGGASSGGLVANIPETTGVGETIVDSLMKSLLSGNFEQIGATLSQKLATTLNSIDWKSIQGFATNFASSVARFLNGAIKPETFKAVGNTIGNALNTVIYSGLSFVETFDWYNFGESVAVGITSSIESADFSSISDLLSSGVAGAINAVAGFVANFDVSTIMNAIQEFLVGIDWKAIGDSIKTLLQSIDWATVFEIVIIVGIGSIIKAKLATLFTATILPFLKTQLTNLKTAIAGLNVGGMLLGALGLVVLIEGFRSIFTEGPNWQNILMVLAGAIMIMVGAIWAFNSALLASPITWIIAGIMALIAVIALIVVYWEEIKEAFSTAAKWFNDNVIKPIKNFFKGLWNSVSGFFSSLWNDIVGIWQSVSGWFNKNVIQPIKNFFSGLWDGLKDGAKGAWNGIKSVFSTVANFFKDIFSKAWEGVIGVFSVAGDIFVNIKDGIVSVFKTVVNGLIDGINSVVKLPFEGLNGILDTIHDISIAGVKPFDWLTWRAPVPQLPKLATGAVLPPNKPFMAIVGDQKHGTNIEAPLDTIVEAMNIALQQNGNQQVNIIAKGDLDSIISLFKFEIERKDQLAGATI